MTEQAANSTFTDTLVVVVERTNNAPEGVDITERIFAGNPAVGTAIGDLLAIDIDPYDTHTFALAAGVADNQFFVVEDSVLKTSQPLRYREQSSFTLQLEVTDDFGETTTDTLSIFMLPPTVDPAQAELVRAVLDSAYEETNGNLGDSYTPGDSLYKALRIEIQAEQVVQIDLSNLGLTRVVAENLLQLPNLQRVQLNGNALDFADLEVLAEAPFELIIVPQALLGEPQQVVSLINTPATLVAERTTEEDQIQWFKNNQAITGETATELQFPATAFADAGTYSYTLRNALFPNLELRHQPITLSVFPALLESDSLAIIELRELLPPAVQTTWELGTLAASWPGCYRF